MISLNYFGIEGYLNQLELEFEWLLKISSKTSTI